MTLQKVDRQCKGRAKSGKPCRAAATEGGFCFFHANPNKAVELGRIGGRSHRKKGVESADQLPALNSVAAVRDTVARWIVDVCAGKLNPRTVAGLAPLVRLQLHALGMLDMADLQQRVAKVEKLLEQKAGEPSPEPYSRYRRGSGRSR